MNIREAGEGPCLRTLRVPNSDGYAHFLRRDMIFVIHISG